MKNLVDISDYSIAIDLRYATKNNVTNQQLYKHPFCALHPDAALRLKHAIKTAADLNLKIKIFDTYRPLSVQKFMFEKLCVGGGNKGFISDPLSGVVPHCRGVAIDLTLIDQNGNELDMGSEFDEFSEIAHHDYDKISFEARRNRLLLLGIMSEAGFDFYSKEWWHYQLFKPREYPIIEEVEGVSMFEK